MKLIEPKTFAAGVLGLSLVLPGTEATAQQKNDVQQPASQASATMPVLLNLQAQPLEQSLAELSQRTGIGMIFATKDVARDLRAPALQGTYAPEEALKKLLEGSGLDYSYVNPRTVTIRTKRESRSGETGQSSSTHATGSIEPAATGSPFRVAQLQDAPGDGAVDESAAENSRRGVQIEEIVVSAQKRIERLQDVPVPVTAINGESLVNSNQLRLQDYYTRIPGLSMTPSDARGGPRLTIRGVTTGGVTNPTVGIVIDDVPYGGSTNTALGYEVPDIDPSDLARIEVLRGPQGTLYGASSIGGLVNFVTIEPSMDGFSGRIQATSSAVHHGDDLGYGVRGAINAPISDTFAIRASGFTRRDPGYIDDPSLGREGVNQSDTYGGRLSALWRASDTLSLKMSVLHQDRETDGSNAVFLDPSLGELEHSMLFGTGVYNNKVTVLSASLKAQLGSTELNAISGYSINKLHTVQDLTPSFGPFTENGLTGFFPGFGVPGTPYLDDIKTKKFTQELRLSGPIGDRIQWLVGAFYNRENTDSITQLLAQSIADPGVIVGSGLNLPQSADFTEYALFADVTFTITDRFDLQIGGRQSHNEQAVETRFIGPFTPIFTGQFSPFTWPEVQTKEDAFTYLLTPRFRVSPSLMVYARFASGYRPGGPNASSRIVQAPEHFKSDSTENYEVGIKGDLFDRALSFDASVYYVDWKDIQLFLSVGGVGANSNGSRAKSQGVELSVESHPLTGLRISGWASYNDAQLSEDIPPSPTLFGQSGARLPYGNHWSGSVSIDQEIPLSNALTGFIGASASYVGERLGNFEASASQPRRVFPSYTKVDVLAGLRRDSWTANLFVNNATDRRGVLTGAPFPVSVTYIEPRTLGVSVAKSF